MTAGSFLRRSKRGAARADAELTRRIPLIFVKPPVRRRPEAVRTTGMEATMRGCGKILLALALMMTAPIATMAQTTDNQPAPSGQQPSQAPPSQPAAQAPASPPPAQPEQQLLKPEQLEALVAPIAPYPHELLANAMAPSTYPP